MNIAPPPRPVPDSTRSPAMPDSRTRSRHSPQVLDPAASHVGVRERRARVPGVRERTGAPLLDQLVPLQLHLARRVAELRPFGHLAELDAAREVLEPELVVEVQLVEQRRREQVEVAVRAPAHEVAAAVVVVVLEEDRLQAGRLRDLQQHVLALGRLEPVEQRGELGLALEPLVLDDDREPEVDRGARARAAAGRTRRRSRRARSSRRCARRPPRPRCSAAG